MYPMEDVTMRYWMFWLFAPKAFRGRKTRHAYVKYMLSMMFSAETYMDGEDTDTFGRFCDVIAHEFALSLMHFDKGE